MTWFKVDDTFHSHPKVLATRPGALGLWVVAGSWSSANLTGGFVSDQALSRLLPGATRLAKELASVGLWKRTKGGYQFHDWTLYNPSAEEEQAKRRARAEAGRKGGIASGKSRAVGSKSGSNGEANASGVASDLVEPPSRPVPTHIGVDVDQSSYGRNALAHDDDRHSKIDDTIVRILADETGVTVPADWAAKIRRQILDGRDVDKPVTYVTKALRERPRDFLPPGTATASGIPPGIAGLAPLGERDNPANAPGAAAARAAIGKTKPPAQSAKEAGP